MSDSPDEEIIPVPGPSDEETGSADGEGEKSNAARAELNLLGSGLSADELMVQARRNEHKRDQHFKDVFEKVSVWALHLLFIGLVIFGSVWGWHIIAPESMRWLSPDRADKLQDVVTGGLLFGIIIDHFRKRMR